MSTTLSELESPSTARSRSPLWRSGLVATGIAAATNLAIYLAGRAGGVDFVGRLSPDADLTEVVAGHVLVTTIIPLLLGTAVAVLIRRRGHGLGLVRLAGAAVAVLSLAGPISLDADPGTKVLLAAMHLVAGAAFVAILRPGRGE